MTISTKYGDVREFEKDGSNVIHRYPVCRSSSWRSGV